jgi:glycosyltransferase involved in cell wall biosynthesis
MPGASVLIPCFNAEETISECLRSLKAQTFTDFEVILVDDGSTDLTRRIIQNWADEDSRFKVYRQAHSGIISALNVGLSVCQAEFVARMDADDKCHPGRLAKQVAYLEQNKDIGVLGSLVRTFPKDSVRQGFQVYINWINSLVDHEQICREIFVESPLVHPSVTFRKAVVEAAGRYQEMGWAEDYDLWLRLFLAGVRFAKLPEVLLDWREAPNRLTRKDSRYSLENFLRAKAHYLKHGPLTGRDAVILWGAGMTGRRLSKHLLRSNLPLVAYIDIDPHKIGRTRYGIPIHAPERLLELWKQFQRPILLAAVGARGARQLIRRQLIGIGLVEGRDWLAVA